MVESIGDTSIEVQVIIEVQVLNLTDQVNARQSINTRNLARSLWR